MNETNKENFKNTNELTTTDNGSPTNSFNDTGNGSVNLSDGNNAETPRTTTGSVDGSPSDDRTLYSNQSSDSVSNNDIVPHLQGDAETLVQAETIFQQDLVQINSTLSSLNVTLTLILAFLLFEWTEKKLKVITDKFTDKRRHR